MMVQVTNESYKDFKSEAGQLGTGLGTCKATIVDSNSNRPSDLIWKWLADSKIFESTR